MPVNRRVINLWIKLEVFNFFKYEALKGSKAPYLMNRIEYSGVYFDENYENF